MFRAFRRLSDSSQAEIPTREIVAILIAIVIIVAIGVGAFLTGLAV